MDCRRTLAPALWLLTGALGCAHDRGPAPVRETPPPPLASGSPYAPSKREGELPKRQPLASTCVQAGNFFAGEASALDKGSTAQEQMRDKARRAFQQAIAIDPNHLSAYQSLGHLYLDMSDYEHAVATYQKALRIQPRHGAVWFDLGMCQARHRDWPAALDSLQRAVGCDPENRQYINTLGFAFARAGRFQDSLNCFMRSCGNEALAQYQLARMLQHLGQIDQCRQCLQAALRLDPNLEQARALLVQVGTPPASAAGVRTIGFAEGEPTGADSRPGAAPQPDELPQELNVPQAPPQPPARPLILPPPPTAGNWRGPGQ